MLKTQQLKYPYSNSKGFLNSFFCRVYDFCVDKHLTFIVYAHPHKEEEEIKKVLIKQSRVGKNKLLLQQNRQKRTLRILIGGGDGLKQKLFLDLRDITPAHPGFIFSPFNSSPSRPRFSFFEVQIIIPLDNWYLEKNFYRGKVHYRNGGEAKDLVDQLKKFLIVEQLNERDRANDLGLLELSKKMYVTKLDSNTSKKHSKNNILSTGKKEFCRQIKEQSFRLKLNAEKRNHLNGLKKVVVSRLKTLPLPSNFSLSHSFFKMIDDFPFSFINLVSGPEVGTWMGASPEILVRRDSMKIFHTVSLAGTQWLNSENWKKNEHLLHQVAWTQKEIEEQAVTSRFIIDCFKKIRLREYREEGPVTVRKGNLLHLQSTFTVDLKRYYGDSLPYEMIALLHPTPAVGGMPQSLAIKEINRIESHDRRYYAGYLGPIEIDKSIDLYVNLRCMELVRIEGRSYCGLYSGVGVNHFSEPEKEWEESNAKMKWWIDHLNEREIKLK